MRTPRQWFRDKFGVNPPKREDWPDRYRSDWDRFYGHEKTISVRPPENVTSISRGAVSVGLSTDLYVHPVVGQYRTETDTGRVYRWDGTCWVLNETREQRRERVRDEMLTESQRERRLDDANRTRAFMESRSKQAADIMNKRFQNKDSVASKRLIEMSMQVTAERYPHLQTWGSQEEYVKKQVRGVDRRTG